MKTSTKENNAKKFIDKANKLVWTTEKRKINDLIPCEINPRKISDEKQKELLKKIEKFNLVEIPVINKDNILISGHQRCKCFQILGRGEELIDVRVPNRQLTDKEKKEYMVISNRHDGEFDFEILELEFSDIKEILNFNEIDDYKKKSEQTIKDLSNNIKEKFIVEVNCINEREQENIYNELLKKGYECRILTL